MGGFKLLFVGIMVTLLSCRTAEPPNGAVGSSSPEENKAPLVHADMDTIKARNKLIAITGYDANSYFLYKGRPMGYEYELLKKFAESLDLKLELVVARNKAEIFEMLERGEGDILAANLTVTKQRAEKFSFTEYLSTTRQVLVQKKPDNWQKMKLHEIDNAMIRIQIDLIGKRVHVRKASSYVPRLQNLSDEIGGDINIVEEAGDISTDALIKQVADGTIPFTVSDENIALINQAYLADIDIATPLSFPQQIAWAVRKNSPQLLEAANVWIRQAKKTSDYYVIYNKYYKNRRGFRTRVQSEFFSYRGGKISKYDDMIQAYAKTINWDWRILASQIYQESRFDPEIESWAGAVGLMQLLPETAKDFGVTQTENPSENIKAGTKYIHWLENYWDHIPDEEQRMKFVLGSYNAGQGHVADARRLAEKFGKDQNVWDGNVEEYILRLSERKYFDDDVVRYGYCRGEEPFQYVRNILARYEEYREFLN